MFRVYLNYFFYILQHKYYVAIECLLMGMPLHAITHDLSKFLPSEFFPYVVNFFAAKQYLVGKGGRETTDEDKERFGMAWLHHQHRNKHHWDYWVDSMSKAHPMPLKYIRQMIADWRGMGRKFNDTAEDYYKENKFKMMLHPKTERILDRMLYHLDCQ